MKKHDYLKFLLIILIVLFMTGCGTSNITTPSKPVVNSFTASPLTIASGESSTLAWSVSDATSVSIDQGVGSSLALSSSASVSPTIITTYTLIATNAAGTGTAMVQITVSVITYTVTFDSQGGSAISLQVVPDGGLVTEPTAPTRTGYAFGGWCKESGCTDDWVFNTDTVTSDVILYAKWTPLYALRDTGPAGGLIFYVKEGGYSDGWRYLEAAPATTEWTDKKWDDDGERIGGTETDIGKGQSNTTTIINTQGPRSTYAAQLCNAMVCCGYNDWFFPSKDELKLMYTNLHTEGVGGFADSYYWSSSEYFAYDAWYQYFGDGGQGGSFKGNTYRVRAVRAF
jgi:uncharacterized repeat protein (TIGR02543 family)